MSAPPPLKSQDFLAQVTKMTPFFDFWELFREKICQNLKTSYKNFNKRKKIPQDIPDIDDDLEEEPGYDDLEEDFFRSRSHRSVGTKNL